MVPGRPPGSCPSASASPGWESFRLSTTSSPSYRRGRFTVLSLRVSWCHYATGNPSRPQFHQQSATPRLHPVDGIHRSAQVAGGLPPQTGLVSTCRNCPLKGECIARSRQPAAGFTPGSRWGPPGAPLCRGWRQPGRPPRASCAGCARSPTPSGGCGVRGAGFRR